MIREVLLASLFGSSSVVAAVRAAQAATFIPVNFFTADVLSAGFLPLYCKYAAEDAAKANTLFRLVAALLFSVSVVVVGLLLLGAHFWVSVLVPGFGPEERAYTVDFIDIFALGVPFYIAGGLFSYRDMGHGSYILISARATLQSAGMIIGTVTAFYFHLPKLLAWGFTGAYILYSLWGFQRTLALICGVPRTENSRVSARDVASEFWSVVKPLMLLPIFMQLNIAAERAVASFLGVNVAASLDYAKFITETGVLLIAVPLGLASLSVISRMSDDECRALLERVLPGLLLITIPLSTALAVHSHLIIAFIYQRGAFGPASTTLTQTILWAFGVGFWTQVISYVLVKTLSARLRNREVFRFMALALTGNVILNICLYKFAGPSTLGIGNCVYGLVLTVSAARALGVGSIVLRRATLLALGAVGYSLCALALPRDGRWAIATAILFFCCYWTAFASMFTVLRTDALGLIVRFRSSSNVAR